MAYKLKNKQEGKKLLKEFEYTIEMAELRALSKKSLEHPLTDREFKRMHELGIKYKLIE
jgi:hypothetical protein